MNQTKIILWGLKASPYVRKIMVALAEKQISYEQKEILPKIFLERSGQDIPADFERASPLGKIPALQINNFCIADSSVISAYLDRKFPTGTSLYPDNPEDYAKSLWFERYADITLSDVAYKKIFMERIIKPALYKQEGDEQIARNAIQNDLPLILDYLDNSVSKNSWISGNNFSMADIAIVVQLLALKTAGFELENKWPNLSKYIDKNVSRPSFRSFI